MSEPVPATEASLESAIGDDRSVIADNTELLDLQSHDLPGFRWRILDEIALPDGGLD